jgi:hypothetical protein
MSQKNAIVS